ncbi:DUF3769 domain-containing protein [Alkalinema sp. FACHB-956]|uniref:DUF3769 domain-containing protein n=1 Tax=Alkalinema sp. FACHB-956 TaxID=2692768 RepID=UPI0016851EAB|nr:DUF3769 domain-containing protein [Alkalinema sp. FACHB-956]MBD2326341.1 DUF3769 domain-containing protein [Alkalinema sp. FACHB-956]
MPYPVAPPDPPAYIRSFEQSRPSLSADTLMVDATTNVFPEAQVTIEPSGWMISQKTLSQDLLESQNASGQANSPGQASSTSATESTDSTESTESTGSTKTQFRPARPLTTPLPPTTEGPQPESNPPESNQPKGSALPSRPGQPPIDTTKTPSTATPSTATPSTPTAKLAQEGLLELKADRQDYDERRQIFTAEGNVSMRFRGSLLKSDRLQVNLLNRFAVADGNVQLTRGDQVLQGERFEYNFVQGEGKVRSLRGDVFLPSAGTDFAPNLPTDISAGAVLTQPVIDRVYTNQPAQNVTGGPGGSFTLGARNNSSGGEVIPPRGGQGVRRVRFEAADADFYPEGWTARDVRITNDPFSPPELELRAKTATFTRLSPLRDEIRAEKPRLVFDQRFSLPLLRNRVVIDRRPRQPGLFSIGFDSDDRGGLFIERPFDILPPGPVQFVVTPQFYLQRAVQEGGSAADWLGVKAKLVAPFGNGGVIRGSANLTSFNFDKFETNFRANLRAAHPINTGWGPHVLALEASYRDRLFNNSLGFQDVQSSVGALFFSPSIPLGKTGINLSYQVGYQYINADTDRIDLLKPIRDNNRISLSRFQGSVALSKGFLLWQGKPLPATPTQGLRYTPTPVVPYISLGLGSTGVATAYSSGDVQNNVVLSASLSGQFGHFSRPFFDYTGFNVTYSRTLPDGLSPFLFDRAVDNSILSVGLVQQIYGPIRLGVQTAWNLDPTREISTDYFVEYSRRTYSVRLRYNPVLSLGSISLTINDFNWSGGSEPFSGSDVVPVGSGVSRPN